MTTSTVNHHVIPRHYLRTPPPPPGSITLCESRRHFCPSFLIPNKLLYGTKICNFRIASCLPPPQSSSTSRARLNPSTKLFVSGLSFRTTEETLKNAFKNFGELVEVNLVMDKIANRPRGFAFLSYATEEESKKAIEGMHGKAKEMELVLQDSPELNAFLDGRVIFVEVAKSRTELRQGLKQKPG